MIVTLKVLTDVYSKPDKNGQSKVIKKNQEYLKQFETTGLLVEHYLNSKGTPSKRWCVVKQEGEYFRLNHKFEEIEQLTKPITIHGFKGQKGKR